MTERADRQIPLDAWCALGLAAATIIALVGFVGTDVAMNAELSKSMTPGEKVASVLVPAFTGLFSIAYFLARARR